MQGPDPALRLAQGKCQALVLRREHPGGTTGRILPQDDVGTRMAGYWDARRCADLSSQAALATPWVPHRQAVTCRGEKCVLQGVRPCKAFIPAERRVELLAVPPSHAHISFLCSCFAARLCKEIGSCRLDASATGG